MKNMRHNFIIILVANFIVAAAATMIMPFLSLYIDTLGDFSDDYVQTWAGLIFAATFVTAFLMSPIWGRIADKYGYKPIMIINCFGVATSIFLMGYVQNVEQFFVLRLVMGVVTGFIPTSIAFISRHTPKEVAGKTLGTLQMGSVGGTLFGPVLGGLMADTFGFKYTFIITAVAIGIAAVIIIVGIHEPTIVRKTKNAIYASKNVIWAIFHHRLIINVMLVTTLIQIGNFSIQPLLSLYVSELTPSQEVALLAGITFSAAGLGNICFARFWGKLSDHYGYEKILSYLLIVAVIIIIPQAFVTELWQLIGLRFLFGIVSGGLIPITSALIRREAPIEVQGEIMGYNQSFRFLGNILGPVLGGVVASIGGIHSVFYSTSLLFLIAFIVMSFLKKLPEQNMKELLKNHA
ncbi:MULTISPECIES: MFS transporter [Solibacillus]|uniref:MFS transporter n=1 Tax=Solibacillus merdavium TaxID=2762218 RepID=A0ABR8XN10_9BACL|nr:MFS transporter [Solibacillus merdavium]MBD8033296.1 MFS transporter [Solibacillus merdavium]